MEANDDDFCERLPGQHTGRLSLELQASEAAEWQMRLEQMEKETQRLRMWIARQESKIRELTASPAAAESPVISPEPAQAHEYAIGDLVKILVGPDTGSFGKVSGIPSGATGHIPVIANGRGFDVWYGPDEITTATPYAAVGSPGISPEPAQGPVEGRKENQDTITGWANATFGPADSNIRIVARANEEMAELLRALSADDENPKAAEEIADVVIVLYRVASRLGYDLHELIDHKMEINRGREWNRDNTGHGYHVRDKSETATTTPATPSAAVGADRPGAGDDDKLLPCLSCGCEQVELITSYSYGSEMFHVRCGNCMMRTERSCGKSKVVETWNSRDGSTVPRAEYDRVVKLMNHFRDVIAEYHDMATADSKPTNVHNPESEDTPSHNPVLGPVVGTATVTFHNKSKTVPPEVGKRYVCGNGEITGVVARDSDATTYPFNAIVPSAGLTSWTNCGRVFTDRLHEHDLIAEYIEPEPSPSAESLDDWVTQDRVSMRECDQIRWINVDTDLPFCNQIGEWSDVVGPVRHVSHGFIDSGKYRLEIRCRRKDLPVVPADKPRMRQVTLRECKVDVPE